ncbi:MAG: PKD domain-containing protein [Ferruginibacter sp.]
MKKLLYLLTVIFCIKKAAAQQYTVNRDATKDNCHCYTLTPDVQQKSGSVWNNNKISLANSFDFKFDIFLGCNQESGADGIAFVLQPISTSIGGTGGGLGFSGINPSVGVTLDTYQNTGDNDPTYDHIDIQFNGSLHHAATPPRIISTSDEAEDCKWHTLRVRWDAAAKLMEVYVDDVQRTSLTRDIIKDIFSNDPMVFWGFTGATGGSSNKQQFCTSLTPQVAFLPTQKKCIGETVKFIDSTRSFGPVKSWSWDFGDGNTSTDQSPTHTYITAKEYDVKLQVEGADLCVETITQKVTIGSFPTADFTANDACSDAAISFTDNSTVSVGTVSKWNWDINGTSYSIKNPSQTFASLTNGGIVTATLSVETELGCGAGPVQKTVKIFSQPVADFTGGSGCDNNNFAFTDASKFTTNDPDLNGIINEWNWNFGGGKTAAIPNPSPVLNIAANPTASLQVTSSRGCKSAVVSKPVVAFPKPTAAFRNNNVCPGKPAAFFDESISADGSAINKWWWDLGQGVIAADKDPTHQYAASGNVAIRLAVSSANGCLSDTIQKNITVITAVAADFTIEQPLCENAPIRFTDNSLPAGNIQSWSWSFNNGKTSTDQHPSAVFTAGARSASLTVKDDAGCGSSSTTKNFTVFAKPSIDFSFSGGCQGAPVVFAGESEQTASITGWHWNFGDNSTDNIQNPEHTYSNAGIYQINLFAEDLNSCFSDTVMKIADLRRDSVFAGKDIVGAINQPIQLQAVSNSTGEVTYLWTPAVGLDNSNKATPVTILSNDQTYVVKATTASGCESTDTITVKVYAGPEIYVPSAFTPDGNNINDVLHAIPAGIKIFRTFSVYNRLGELVFQTADPARGWDGRFRGKMQTTGVYVWIANGTDYRGNIIARKGTVVLIR